MAQEIADSTLLDTWASSGLIVEPDVSKIIEGWQLGEQPPHEYMNWLQNTFGSKLNHIFKNGVASWNNETEYLAGATAQHNGNVWLCKTTNTNSAPTDANANWKRIITVEALITVLAGYVTITGNQTIAGVKTFSSNIIGNVTGNSDTATKLQTARIINGVSFDGSANISVGLDTQSSILTASFTLDNDHKNKVLICIGTFNISLPNVSTIKSGDLFIINNSGTGTLSLIANGNSTNLSRLTILPGEVLILQSDGGAYYRFVSRSKDFASSLGATGYTYLPNGLIMQWGSATTAGGGAAGVTFPIAFPNSAFQVSLGLISGSPVNALTGFFNLTNAGMDIFTNAAGSTIQLGTVSYIVIGR